MFNANISFRVSNEVITSKTNLCSEIIQFYNTSTNDWNGPFGWLCGFIKCYSFVRKELESQNQSINHPKRMFV